MLKIVQRAIATLFVTLTAVGTAVGATQDQYTQPPPLPGWTHTATWSPQTAQKHGLAVSGSVFLRGSPTIAEIDGDTSNGKEVAIIGDDARLYVLNARGTLIWSADLPTGQCAPVAGDARGNSAPAVGAIYGDGVPYVVASFGTIQPSSCDGGVTAYRGSSGARAWVFSLRNWQAQQGYPAEGLYGVVSSPGLADTDGDGDMEIGFGGLDRNVYLLNADGSARWYYHAADTIWSSPAFANVAGSEELEMVIGTDMSDNGAIGAQSGGYLYAFDTAARPSPRVEFCMPAFPHTCVNSVFLWRMHFEQTIFSSPVVADVLSSNPGEEIVIGNGCYFPIGDSNKTGRWIKILRASDGAVLRTLSTPACIQSSVAVGDIDDDGALEIAATVSGASAIGGPGRSQLMVYEPESGGLKWSVSPGDPNDGKNDAYGGDLMSPFIADMDGNGSLEVLVANSWSVHIYNGRTGAALSCQGPPCGALTSLFTLRPIKSTPAVGDINNDGVLDVVIGSGHFQSTPNGVMYAWTNFAGLLKSPVGQQSAYAAPWPMFRGDASHSGHLLQPDWKVTPEALSALLVSGERSQESLRVEGVPGAPLGDWRVSESSDPNNIVVLNTTSGGGSQTLGLILNAPATPGTYAAEITFSSGQLPEKKVAISLRVVKSLNKMLLPFVRR